MSTNAKPVARVPTTPASAPETEAVTAESLGWQLRSALPPMRLHSVSLYNNDADVLWLSEGALGPDEHNVVVEAIEHLKTEKGQLYHELGMEDGRISIFLGIRGPRGDLVGTVMILADMKSVSEGTMDRVLTMPVKTLMHKMAVFLRKMYPQASSGGDTSQMVAIPVPPADAKTSATVTTKTLPAASEPLAPKQVEAILTLELIEPPPPEPAKAEKGKGAASAPTLSAVTAPAKAPPVMKAVPRKAPPAAASVSEAHGSNAGAKGSAIPPRIQAAQPAPAAALPEIEVLPFDAGISIPTARPATTTPAPITGVEVLPFDANIQIPTARPAPVTAAPIAGDMLAFDANIQIPTAYPAPAEASAEIEVLDFGAELTIPPGAKPASGAVLKPPVAKAAPRPAVEPLAKSPAAAPSKAPPAAGASSSAGANRAAFETTSTSTTSNTSIGLRTAKAAAATVSVPLLNTGSTTNTARAPKTADEDVLLIQDTGPFKKLEMPDETAITPALPAMPPPPPLTAEETATDLTLFVQELIKLRSSGRTRRYEVLARSQRDAGRNEVPTAFVAESAKGSEGAALDGLVVERLLQWLGKHGETIWDSEPASFSVNLSIGALEDTGFPEKIGKWLEQYNVPAEYVGFEISEFACVQCRPAVQRFVEACEKLGCFLVIDNFSFDSNMFEFLGSKALRHVKIDPKLTTAAMKEKLPQALVVAILQACKVLGVHCVAKRIESQSSLQWLTAVGCDFAQSFQLEKPVAIDGLVSGKSIKALRE